MKIRLASISYQKRRGYCYSIVAWQTFFVPRVASVGRGKQAIQRQQKLTEFEVQKGKRILERQSATNGELPNLDQIIG
jgi:hypothetical protein